MQRSMFITGAFSAFLCVAIGAFGTHGLQLSEHYNDIYQTGVKYHMFHSVALLVAAFAWNHAVKKHYVVWAGRMFGGGIVLFSGSLYALSITEIGIFGAITPLGGLAFLTGWIMLSLSVMGNKRKG